MNRPRVRLIAAVTPAVNVAIILDAVIPVSGPDIVLGFTPGIDRLVFSVENVRGAIVPFRVSGNTDNV